MRAYQLEKFGFDGLVLREMRDPEPGPHQVLIELRSASINYRDLLMIRGLYDKRMPLPMTPLSDGAGVVAAIGPGVTAFKNGDKVVGAFSQGWIDGEYDREKSRTSLGGPGPGMLATHVVLNENGVVRMPANLSFEEAATMPCAGVTAWNALFCERPLKAGETVLVQGTGGVSIYALQLAVAAGARVIVTSSSDAKLERAKSLGAWQTINYRTIPDWGAEARQMADGAGVDYVIEVGGTGTFKQSVDAVRFGGRIAIIGVLSGSMIEMSAPMILHKSIVIRGMYVGSVAMLRAMAKAIEVNKVQPVIGARYPFAQSLDALHSMESSGHFGKVVISV